MDSHSERKSEACYRAIRQMIVDNELRPGSFIDKTELCTRLDVSRQPVTAALTRLEREGLVDILPQRGSYVSRLSLGALVESTTLRAAIEQFVAGRLTDRFTPDLVDRMRETAERHAEAVRAQYLAKVLEHDAEFHRTLASASGLPRLSEQVEIGLAAMIRARIAARPDIKNDSVDEHRAIVSALADGDGPRAAETVAGHILAFLGRIQSAARDKPDIFVG